MRDIASQLAQRLMLLHLFQVRFRFEEFLFRIFDAREVEQHQRIQGVCTQLHAQHRSHQGKVSSILANAKEFDIMVQRRPLLGQALEKRRTVC